MKQVSMCPICSVASPEGTLWLSLCFPKFGDRMEEAVHTKNEISGGVPLFFSSILTHFQLLRFQTFGEEPWEFKVAPKLTLEKIKHY